MPWDGEHVTPATDRVNILLIDDRPEQLLVLETILDELNQNLVKACSGREALRFLLKHSCAVILLDVNMPDMDGFETAALIRQREQFKHTPIIFLTADSDGATYVSHGYALGAVDYLHTPVVPEILKSKVSVFVELSKKSEQLKWQQEELARSNADLETLLYVTSHDLREPLRAVQSFARLVHDRYAHCLDDKGQDFLGRIARGADRLDRLLEDILTLSRARRLAGPVEEVEGTAIVTEVLDRLAVRVKETRARIQVADDLPRLCAERTWATQAVYNLVANALKFTRDGEPPDVEIAGYEEANNDDLERGLVVRDRGPGVAPEHAERIFQLFQRAVSREVEGTGAGLAIVRQVAQRHGGRAWVRPRPGGGSEFLITFQVVQRNGPVEAPLHPFTLSPVGKGENKKEAPP